MTNRSTRTTVVVIAVLAVVAAGAIGLREWRQYQRRQTRAALMDELRRQEDARVRATLLEVIRPVALSNCDLKRFGGPADGGYLLCANLLEGVESAYSYGIANEDDWGCEVSRRLKVPVHQYDCFTPDRPRCEGGTFVFHAECVGDVRATRGGRPFDTVVNQIDKNGDSGKRVLIKMDVEGSELESLMAMPDEALAEIPQLPMEIHGVSKGFLGLVQKLKRTFYIVSVHFNNHACTPDAAPLPGVAFQVLLVNKRLAVLDPNGRPQPPDAPPLAPDRPEAPDCQPHF